MHHAQGLPGVHTSLRGDLLAASRLALHVNIWGEGLSGGGQYVLGVC